MLIKLKEAICLFFIFLKGGIELEQMLEKWYEFFDKERLNKWIDEDKENRSGFIAGVNEKTLNEIRNIFENNIEEFIEFYDYTGGQILLPIFKIRDQYREFKERKVSNEYGYYVRDIPTSESSDIPFFFENTQSLDGLDISGGSTENNEIIELLNKLLGEISSVKKMNIENNHILNEIGKRFYNIGNSKFDINDEQIEKLKEVLREIGYEIENVNHENKKNFQIILQHINTFETNKNNKISKYKDHIIEYAKNNIFRFTVICSSISIFITIVLIKIMEVFVK